MKFIYIILLIFLLTCFFSISLGKTVYESVDIGCNGDKLENCVKKHGEKWCYKNCRDALPGSYCNGDTWKGCLKANKQVWCQNNCKDTKGKLYVVGIK